MSNATDLLIRLLVDDSDMDKFDKAGERLKKDMIGSAMTTAGTGASIALGGLAVGAIAAGNAAADAEQSTQQLQFALSQFPATADTSASKLMDLNSQLAMKTQFDDDALASGQAILAQYDLTGSQIEELTPLLADYAAKTGQDIPGAAESLGKAMMGQGRALKDVGIDFTDTGSLGGNYAAVLDGLTDKVGGFAESQGTTAQGSSAIFQNTLGELMETLGQGLLPVMVSVTRTGASVVGWMTQNAGVVKGLAIATGILSAAVLLTVGAYKGFMAVQAVAGVIATIRTAQAASAAVTGVATGATTANTVAVWANNAAWLANPITWIVLAIVVAIGLLVAAGIWLWNNWGAVTQAIGAAWNWLWSNVLSPVFTAIGTVFGWIFNNIIMPIVTGIMIYIGLWAAIITWLWGAVISPVFNAIGAVFGWIWNSIISPVVTWISEKLSMLGLGFQLLWAMYVNPALIAIGGALNAVWNSVISPVFNAIGGAVGWIGNTVRDVFGGIASFIGSAFQAALGMVRGPVNGIIGLVNGAIRGLNSLSVSIPAWVPVVGGQTFSLGLPTIPYLATGTITNGPMLAVVGDNPGGREVIAPYDSYRRELQTAYSAGAGVSRPAMSRADIDYLADRVGGKVGETVYPLIMKGSQKTILTALGG